VTLVLGIMDKELTAHFVWKVNVLSLLHQRAVIVLLALNLLSACASYAYIYPILIPHCVTTLKTLTARPFFFVIILHRVYRLWQGLLCK
jgi:hypothetical protein